MGEAWRIADSSPVHPSKSPRSQSKLHATAFDRFRARGPCKAPADARGLLEALAGVTCRWNL
jgi:hypothetical protein